MGQLGGTGDLVPDDAVDAPNGVVPDTAQDVPSVPVDATHGSIQRPGQPVGEVPPAPNSQQAQLEKFDYSRSPLRHIMSEDTARSVVQAGLKAEGVKSTLNDNITNGALWFLDDNVRNHMATMIQNQWGNSGKTWDQLAADYGSMRKQEDKENPVAAKTGQNIATAEELATLPSGTLGAVSRGAGRATGLVASMAMDAAKHAMRWGPLLYAYRRMSDLTK